MYKSAVEYIPGAFPVFKNCENNLIFVQKAYKLNELYY